NNKAGTLEDQSAAGDVDRADGTVSGQPGCAPEERAWTVHGDSRGAAVIVVPKVIVDYPISGSTELERIGVAAARLPPYALVDGRGRGRIIYKIMNNARRSADNIQPISCGVA